MEWPYDYAMCSSIVAAGNGTKALLASGIPLQARIEVVFILVVQGGTVERVKAYYLQLDDLAVQLHGSNFLQSSHI